MKGIKLNPSGVSLELRGVELYEEGSKLKPDIRRLYDLRGVLFDPRIINRQNRDDPLYYMYRGVGGKKNKLFHKNGIRYDITVIPQYRLGAEFNKTLGHYHTIAEQGLEYPEIYEVISGSALFILQMRISDLCYFVELVYGNVGDTLLIPPNYGHITINTGKAPIVLANLLSDGFSSNYKDIIKMGGGAVYVTSNGEIILNKRYKQLSIINGKIRDVPFIKRRGSLYDEFVANSEKFLFLKKPSLLVK